MLEILDTNLEQCPPFLRMGDVDAFHAPKHVMTTATKCITPNLVPFQSSWPCDYEYYKDTYRPEGSFSPQQNCYMTL